ncbi:MAG: hypothetical protein JWM04_2420 [Verrucomicrobiales bacterium]|nr:hypothetical protein [Verrucomicrobiales bacterium]
MLKDKCYDCHGDGESKGNLAFDSLKSDEQILHNPELWFKVLRNTRSGIMPPKKKSHLSPQQQATLEKWIETGAFGIDPKNLDPGRITIRRLNRTDYRNTIRDLMGIDYDTEAALAADDVGYGFDGISDVQTISPMRMEKFLEAAQYIVNKSVPMTSRTVALQFGVGKDFLTSDGKQNAEHLSFYQEREVAHKFRALAVGDYKVVVTTMVDGVTRKDPQRCLVSFRTDGSEFLKKEYVWYDCEFFTDEKILHWEKGEHEISFATKPVFPEMKQSTKMDYKILTVQVQGPLETNAWIHPPGYERFFTRDLPPESMTEKRNYARQVLSQFATKAFRRPVSNETIEQLVDIAETAYQVPNVAFETGVSRAMIAVLASPRFLFRVETAQPTTTSQRFGDVDEYALASRLSYFLWSSMPDDELFKLASEGKLRKNLDAQVKRMFADPKAKALVENFSGQWLQTRDVMAISINRPEVMKREDVTTREQFTGALRESMRKETDAYFNYVARENRNVLELIESDYTFLDEPLAKFYQIPDVSGPDMRKVMLSPDKMRGGVLTMASVLTVTSNPTRTSPVKRGKWVLENILGTPAPPPPPDVPALEDAGKNFGDRVPTQRELLARHREDAICASCHGRMDPLGLAMENFNALGLWRTNELKQPVDAAGQLMSGESFQTVNDLKHILASQHKIEFYRTLTEKLMVYALGRGLEYYDSPSVEKIVRKLDSEEGRFSALLMGVVESAPFQKRRPLANPGKKATTAAAESTPSYESNIN